MVASRRRPRRRARRGAASLRAAEPGRATPASTAASLRARAHRRRCEASPELRRAFGSVSSRSRARVAAARSGRDHPVVATAMRLRSASVFLPRPRNAAGASSRPSGLRSPPACGRARRAPRLYERSGEQGAHEEALGTRAPCSARHAGPSERASRCSFARSSASARAEAAFGRELAERLRAPRERPGRAARSRRDSRAAALRQSSATARAPSSSRPSAWRRSARRTSTSASSASSSGSLTERSRASRARRLRRHAGDAVGEPEAGAVAEQRDPGALEAGREAGERAVRRLLRSSRPAGTARRHRGNRARPATAAASSARAAVRLPRRYARSARAGARVPPSPGRAQARAAARARRRRGVLCCRAEFGNALSTAAAATSGVGRREQSTTGASKAVKRLQASARHEHAATKRCPARTAAARGAGPVRSGRLVPRAPHRRAPQLRGSSLRAGRRRLRRASSPARRRSSSVVCAIFWFTRW